MLQWIAVALAAAPRPRTVEVTNVATGGMIPEQLNGCHFSPLNHQLAVVHSQMVFGEWPPIKNKKNPYGRQRSREGIGLGVESLGVARVTRREQVDKYDVTHTFFIPNPRSEYSRSVRIQLRSRGGSGLGSGSGDRSV